MRKRMNYIDIQNNFLAIVPYEHSVEEVVDNVNRYIAVYDCEKLCVDISVLNLVDAMRVGAICSAVHFAKYPFGALEWVVKDMECRNIMRQLALKTVNVRIKQPIIKDFCTPLSRKVVAIR